MLKFQIGDMGVATRVEAGSQMHGPWRVVSRHYDQTAMMEDRTYKVSRP